MATDPRTAFEQLQAALERFNEIALSGGDPESPQLLRATEELENAYVIYDDVLFRNFGVELPFDVYDTEDDVDTDDDDVDDFDEDLGADDDLEDGTTFFFDE
ncbi:MAG: DNA primase [Actinomycetaceae bacterium]|nr:DNA primase [Actinomycetaceae bacterium]MDY6083219.1 DNA primase [Actinomycetaceae bacterium]